MSLWRTLWYLFITAVAVTAMGFATAVTYVPELLPSNISLYLQRITARADSRLILILLGGVVAIGGIIGLWLWRARGLRTTFFDPEVEESNREVAVAGNNLKQEDKWKSRSDAELSSASVKEALRDVLREIYRTDFDNQSELEAFLDDGEWTTDHYAAAFISTSHEIDYPLRHRIIAWLYPDRARELRVKRSLRAVESVADEQFSLYEPEAPHQSGRFEWIKLYFEETREGRHR